MTLQLTDKIFTFTGLFKDLIRELADNICIHCQAIRNKQVTKYRITNINNSVLILQIKIQNT